MIVKTILTATSFVGGEIESLEQEAQKKQTYFSDVSSVVFNADLFSDTDYFKFEKVIQKPEENVIAVIAECNYANIIVYPVIRLTKSDSDLSSISHQDVLTAVKNQNSTNEFKKVIHIIPEVIPGRLQKMGIGHVDHIVLSVVTQQSDETFQYAYQHHKKTFDPRDFGLSAQNTFDDTNCGRYVTAMTIQAAGLVRDDFVINHANLRVSPAVGAALHFNLEKDAMIGLKHAYVKPLSENPTYREIGYHNWEKIQCLKAEYEARRQNAQRAYHGTSLFGGYRFAGFFSTIFFGYSAAEKLQVIQALEDKDFSKFSAREKKIATQGRLGECVTAILKARQQMQESKHDIYLKK